MTTLSAVHEVAEKVRQYVSGKRPGGVTLAVDEGAIQLVDGWWRVPVHPSAWPRKRYEYYEALAEIESDLQENEQVNVLIATGEPQGEENLAAAGEA